MELSSKRIALFADDLFEDLELWYPYYRLKEAGAAVSVLGPAQETYVGKRGLQVQADAALSESSADDFDALVIPGGYAPDRLRSHPPAIELTREVFARQGVVAFICHAGWVPASAKIVEGRRVTSYPSIRDDLENAGAHWEDQEVVRDGNLISSRRPDDLPAFCRTIIEALGES